MTEVEAADADESNEFLLGLSEDYVLDARHSGSIASFVNHSCNPNCIMQRYGTLACKFASCFFDPHVFFAPS